MGRRSFRCHVTIGRLNACPMVLMFLISFRCFKVVYSINL